MTLVVARVTPLGVRIAGDMRITDRTSARRTGFLGAALKVILIRPTLCIAYAADNFRVALDAIRVVDSRGLSVEGTESELLSAHERANQTADFLIASLRPSRLVAVKNGRAEESDASWIGDQVAFTEYQRHYHAERWQPGPDFYDSVERAGDIGIAHRMANGMESVVFGPSFITDGETTTVTIPSGGSHPTVGEAIVSVVPRVEDNLFKYSEGVHARASPFQAPLPPGLGVVPMDTSAAGGGFTYSILTPAQPGVGVLGVYVEQAQLGLLYAPLLSDEPETYSDMKREAFVELVQLRHGISLVGIGVA